MRLFLWIEKDPYPSRLCSFYCIFKQHQKVYPKEGGLSLRQADHLLQLLSLLLEGKIKILTLSKILTLRLQSLIL